MLLREHAQTDLRVLIILLLAFLNVAYVTADQVKAKPSEDALSLLSFKSKSMTMFDLLWIVEGEDHYFIVLRNKSFAACQFPSPLFKRMFINYHSWT